MNFTPKTTGAPMKLGGQGEAALADPPDHCRRAPGRDHVARVQDAAALRRAARHAVTLQITGTIHLFDSDGIRVASTTATLAPASTTILAS